MSSTNNYYTKITNTTTAKRNQLKSALDEFCTFYWGGESAWDKFGAFIINDQKGSLKFYNGPGFSNEYTKPQFDSAGGSLQGVNFNKQTISFKVGVYWFSIEEYRKLMNWLNPMKIDYLVFGFDLMYRYDVKLSKIGDSTRWVIGRENGEPRYYTELDLTFEIQGAPCAKGTHPYEFKGNNDLWWNFNTDENIATGKATLFTEDTSSFIASDLETPVKVSFNINLSANQATTQHYYSIESGGLNEINYILDVEDESSLSEKVLDVDGGNASIDDLSNVLELSSPVSPLPEKYNITLEVAHNNNKILLVDVILQNLTFFTEKAIQLTFTYNSETGLVFLKSTEDTPTLLTLSTYADTNDFLIESLITNKFMLPGKFQYNDFYDQPVEFILTFKKYIDGNDTPSEIADSVYKQPINIECFPRTNII